MVHFLGAERMSCVLIIAKGRGLEWYLVAAFSWTSVRPPSPNISRMGKRYGKAPGHEKRYVKNELLLL